MSVLDQIRKLDEQKASLLTAAKQEAITAANAAIKTLNELGFHFQLVEGSAPARTGTRRTGIREEVLAALKKKPMSRAQLLESMGAKGNKSLEQSISNATSALKKSGAITIDNGTYKAK